MDFNSYNLEQRMRALTCHGEYITYISKDDKYHILFIVFDKYFVEVVQPQWKMIESINLIDPRSERLYQFAENVSLYDLLH